MEAGKVTVTYNDDIPTFTVKVKDFKNNEDLAIRQVCHVRVISREWRTPELNNISKWQYCWKGRRKGFGVFEEQ